MRNSYNYLTYIPKKASIALAISVLVLAAMVTPFFVAGVLSASNQANLDTELRIANLNHDSPTFSDSVDADIGDELLVELYFHNDGDWETGASAQNVIAQINVPNQIGQEQTITSTVVADNDETTHVDTVVANLVSENAYLDYIAGSAERYYNVGAEEGREECGDGTEGQRAPEDCYETVALSDQIVSEDGTLIEESLKPCFAYESEITIRVEVKEEIEEPREEPEEEPREEIPEVLPEAGIGGILGGLFGSAGLGIGIRNWLSSRRKLLDSLLEA